MSGCRGAVRGGAGDGRVTGAGMRRLEAKEGIIQTPAAPTKVTRKRDSER